MSKARSRGRGLASATLAVLLLSLSGCVTASMWDHLDDSRRERVAAAFLTPMTVAVDAALVAGYVSAACCGCEFRSRCD